MLRVSALNNVPDFAKGQVRDLRVRWALEEVGRPYSVRRVDPAMQASAEYRADQPFGQVPVLEDHGLCLFESGAIVLQIAEGSDMLMPRDPQARAAVLSWLFASLNTIEPPVMNLAKVDYFMSDDAMRKARRPAVLETIDLRLSELAAALGARDHLVGGFTAADLMMSAVLRILPEDVLSRQPALAAYRARCEERPAFRRALAAQLADFEA